MILAYCQQGDEPWTSSRPSERLILTIRQMPPGFELWRIPSWYQNITNVTPGVEIYHSKVFLSGCSTPLWSGSWGDQDELLHRSKRRTICYFRSYHLCCFLLRQQWPAARLQGLILEFRHRQSTRNNIPRPPYLLYTWLWFTCRAFICHVHVHAEDCWWHICGGCQISWRHLPILSREALRNKIKRRENHDRAW